MRRIYFVLIAFFGLAMTGTAYADVFDYNSFAHFPIQHVGRIKPLGTFGYSW